MFIYSKIWTVNLVQQLVYKFINNLPSKHLTTWNLSVIYYEVYRIVNKNLSKQCYSKLKFNMTLKEKV